MKTWGLGAAITGLIAATEVAPAVDGSLLGELARLGAVGVLGYVIIRLVDKLDTLSEAITKLREHCAAKREE